MNGSGCKSCPVNPCETMNYRGSTCSAQRAKYGLGDPMTNADRLRAMSDEEMAKRICEIGFDCHLCYEHERLSDNPFLRHEKCDEKCTEHCLEWLKQPAKLDIDTLELRELWSKDGFGGK